MNLEIQKSKSLHYTMQQANPQTLKNSSMSSCYSHLRSLFKQKCPLPLEHLLNTFKSPTHKLLLSESNYKLVINSKFCAHHLCTIACLLISDWTNRVQSPPRSKDFSSSLCSQTRSGAQPASYPMCTRGKMQQGWDNDHSSPSCTEVENE